MANAVCVDNKSNKIKIRSETVRFGELLCNTVKKNVSNKKKRDIKARGILLQKMNR